MTPQSPILDMYTDNKKNTYWYKKDFLEQKENIQLSNKEKQIKLIKKLQETHTFDISLIDDSHKWHLSQALHQDHAPAIEFANGTKVYYSNGLLHREDGPAIEYGCHCTKNEWYFNGIQYSQKEFYQIKEKIKLSKRLKQILKIRMLKKQKKI